MCPLKEALILENSITFKPFLIDVINLAKPDRIHIEFQEIPAISKTTINFRKKIHVSKPMTRILALAPRKTNKFLDKFLDLLDNKTHFEIKIKRVGIICDNGTVQLTTPATPYKYTARHYIFGETIAVIDKTLHEFNSGQLTYVDIYDLEFNIRSLLTDKSILCGDIEKRNRKLQFRNPTIDLPF